MLYSVRLEGAVELHCQLPGGRNNQDAKLQFGAGVAVGQDDGVGMRVGQELTIGQVIVVAIEDDVGAGVAHGGQGLEEGQGAEEQEAVPTMIAARRNKITKGFSMSINVR